LIEAHERERLFFQGRLLCSVLRPRFMTSGRVSGIKRISDRLAAILERYGLWLLESDQRLNLIHASESEREIWSIDPGYPGLTLTSRLDAFMFGNEPRFVEYNAESPAGIGYCDRLSDVFEDLPAVTEWSHTHQIERFYARRHLLESILWAYTTWGGKGVPRIAIVDWEHVSTRRDFELCAEYFRRHGVSTLIEDPRNLKYHSGRLWAGNEEVTLIYRRVLLHELLEKRHEARELLDAYRDGAVCMVNSPRSKILHKKTAFALLSEHASGVKLTQEEIDMVDEVVPWTRTVRSGTTEYHGTQVDIMRFILSERNRLVLKPGDDYGGRGVVLGWETDNAEWEHAVEEAAEKQFVVQERVSVPEAGFPIWKEDRIELVPMLVDTDPLLFRGAVGSILTRISDSAILNVSAGSGSTTPTFAVQES